MATLQVEHQTGDINQGRPFNPRPFRCHQATHVRCRYIDQYVSRIHSFLTPNDVTNLKRPRKKWAPCISFVEKQISNKEAKIYTYGS